MGYLVAGFLGALVAAIGIFLPCYLLVILAAPYYHRFAQHQQVKAFIMGIIAAAIGAIAGSAFILAKETIIDMPTAVIAFIGLTVLLLAQRFPEPVLIIFAGIAGLFLKG
jgi:chromate transporter